MSWLPQVSLILCYLSRVRRVTLIKLYRIKLMKHYTFSTKSLLKCKQINNLQSFFQTNNIKYLIKTWLCNRQIREYSFCYIFGLTICRRLYMFSVLMVLSVFFNSLSIVLFHLDSCTKIVLQMSLPYKCTILRQCMPLTAPVSPTTLS